MRALRHWSVRHARLMESTYALTERALLRLAPVFDRIGHDRLEKPVAAVERVVKGALFDCKMCGQCALSSTGMSCPMNCPKEIRNGPCGGVRADGMCEVKPDMRCVWVEGWQGAQRMKHGDEIANVQFAVDRRLVGSSSWLRVVREKAAPAETADIHAAASDTGSAAALAAQRQQAGSAPRTDSGVPAAPPSSDAPRAAGAAR